MMKKLKYFSTILIAMVALMAGWALWNYYMQSPWTRDGKIRAEQVNISAQVSGRIVDLKVKDNQYIQAGDLLFTLDKTPFQIAELNAQAELAKAQSELARANHEANRRRHLTQNVISAEELDTANMNVKAMQASVEAAQATLKKAEWQLGQTDIRAPVSGWVTNLSTRIGNFATAGQPIFALVDSQSFS